MLKADIYRPHRLNTLQNVSLAANRTHSGCVNVTYYYWDTQTEPQAEALPSSFFPAAVMTDENLSFSHLSGCFQVVVLTSGPSGCANSCFLLLQLMLQQSSQAPQLLMLGGASPCRGSQSEDLCPQVTAAPSPPSPSSSVAITSSCRPVCHTHHRRLEVSEPPNHVCPEGQI